MSLSLLSALSARTAGAARAAVDANADHIAGEERGAVMWQQDGVTGLLLCSKGIRKKIPRRTQQGERHPLCACVHISRWGWGGQVLFVYKENCGSVASISLTPIRAG